MAKECNIWPKRGNIGQKVHLLAKVCTGCLSEVKMVKMFTSWRKCEIAGLRKVFLVRMCTTLPKCALIGQMCTSWPKCALVGQIVQYLVEWCTSWPT